MFSKYLARIIWYWSLHICPNIIFTHYHHHHFHLCHPLSNMILPHCLKCFFVSSFLLKSWPVCHLMSDHLTSCFPMGHLWGLSRHTINLLVHQTVGRYDWPNFIEVSKVSMRFMWLHFCSRFSDLFYILFYLFILCLCI